MEKHPPAYLSSSRLGCYSWCPAEFEKRYIENHDEPPTTERTFGVCVHRGFEAHFKGQDGDVAFIRAWREGVKELDEAGVAHGDALEMRGLEMLDQVRGLGLVGQPERFVSLCYPGFKIPFIGYVDLWGDGHIYDFKTTGYPWTQAKADAQIFQPAIYSQAYFDEHGFYPRFTFVVLTRIAGQIALLDGSRTGAQVRQAFEQARAIHECIESHEFDCKCGKHDLDGETVIDLQVARQFERRKFVV
jgi:hypothetical protein